MEISSNIGRLTQDLNAVMKSLSSGPTEDAAALIDEILSPEVLRDFKLAVDGMRRLLWTYILAASRATSGDINDSIHGVRLQRATEALRSLRQDGIPASGQTMERTSFIEQV